MQLIKDIAVAIITKVEKGLQEIKAESTIQLAHASYQVANKGVRELMDEKEKYSFGHKEEEIEFYKIICPSICQQRIYYIALYHLEAKLPFTDTDKRIAYLKCQLDKYQQYIEDNHEFYTYYRTGQTHLDQTYFTSNPDTPIPLEKTCDCTVCNATAYSNIIAKFQAYERIMTYINNEIYSLTHPLPKINTQQENHLSWTDKKVSLIELAYALYISGSINHGNAPLNLIIQILERGFNVDLGNFYGVMTQNIRLRKESCIYLIQLSTDLKKHLEDSN